MATQSKPRFERKSPFTFHPKIVMGEGPVPAKIMLVGERIGYDEARVGRNFVGKAGELLNTLLAAADLDRKQIYVTNLVKELVDRTTPEHLAKWGPVLEAEIADVGPEIIGCLGTFATEWLLGVPRAELMRTHGVPVHYCNGFHACTLVPMYNPAAALHSPETMNNVLDDFLRLGQLVDGELVVRKDECLGTENYRLLKSYDELPTDRCRWIAIDTEFTPSKVISAQVSWSPGSGLQIDASDGSAVKILKRWLDTVRPRIIVHNYMADAEQLRKLGIDITEYEYRDTMVMAYQLCVEPQGLKALGYRHCGMEMEDYDDLVREHDQSKALDYLMRVADKTDWPDPPQQIVMDKGVPKVYKPQNIGKLVGRALGDLAQDKRDKDGNPVNLRDRWKKWDDEVKGPVIEVLGEMPVGTLEDVDPVRAQHYGIRDADATLRITPILEQKCEDMGLADSLAVDHAILPMIERMQSNGIRIAPGEFWTGIEDECTSQMDRAKYEIFKLTGQEINPGSGDQLAWLLYDHLGLRAPYHTESGSRGSVDGVALESLLSESPVIQHALDYTEASKIRGTYAIPFKKLARSGERVHATFRVTRTTTGRLSMADPPLHQIPIMTELGRQLRAGFIAEDGYVIGDWDVDQLEMRMCAHDSRDPELIRLFNEGRDIHAETACKIFSVPMSQLSVGPSGKVNDLRRTVAKHAGFGIINGITEHGLVNYMILNRCKRPDGESWTLDDCDMLRRGWLDVYKGVDRFQQACIAEAQATGLSRETVTGRVVYLPAIWSPDKRVSETAGRMSYVMHTQGGGAAIVKLAMAEVWRSVCRSHYLKVEPLLQVHDELVMEVPDDECTKVVVNQMMIDALTRTTELIVPMKASGGYAPNWLEAH